MKKRIDIFYTIFISFILLTGVIILVTINYQKNSKEREYFNESTLTLNMAYLASIDKYNLYTREVLSDLKKTKWFFPFFEKGIKSNAEERRFYKGLLFRNINPIYEKLKKEGIRQVHFHLKNNESYLRVNKPNKYGDNLSGLRETVEVANKKNKIVTAFETGRVTSGFRNVFPLNYKNEHLGSIEISVSTKRMVESIAKLDARREYSFILNKSILAPKLFTSQTFLYEPSVVNSNYLIEDMDSFLPDSPKKLSFTAKRINKKLSNNEKLKAAMSKGEKYGAFIKLDGIYYDAAFIPMLGVNKKIEGYIVGYKESKNVPLILIWEKFLYFIVILSTTVIAIMILIIKRKTEILDNKREWFKSITDGLGEGLYVMDENAKITYINPIACKILGYKEEEILGKNAHSLFHSHSFNDNIEQKDCPIFLGTIKNKVFSSKEEYFLSSDGKNIPVSIVSSLLAKDDTSFEIVTSFSDNSIQKELEEKSTLLTKALESSVNCIVITDTNAVVQWANPAFKDLTGFELEDVIGKNPRDFISSGEQTKEFFSDMWQTILNKNAWHGELVNRKKDGTLYNEELIITPVLDKNEEIINFIAVKQDITHKKLMALEKEQKDRMYFQQSKLAAMGEMIGNIAHQWRQPLSTISTAATGAKLQKEMDLLSDDDFMQTMDSINESAQYLSQTIEDFRGFFDPRNSKQTKFLISETVAKTLSLIDSQFKCNEITIVKDIKEISVLSLENELIQVLVNILKNSKDALLKLEEDRFIFINTYEEEKRLIIKIKDNAKGIPLDIIDRIFEPYFTTKHQSQGTGVGLYMSQDIVRNHLDGTITAENEIFEYKGIKCKGASFTIKIALV